MRRTEITTLKHAAVAGAICWFLRWVLDEDERRALRERKLRDYGRRRCEIVIPPPEPCECHGDPWCEDDK